MSLTYCIPLVKDQSSFYEIRILTIYININAFSRVNRKQLNILKAFWNICNFILLLTKDDSILKVILPGLVAYKPVAYKKKVYTKWRRREILKSPVQCLRDLDIQQQKSSYHKSSLVKQILIMIDKHMSN